MAIKLITKESYLGLEKHMTLHNTGTLSPYNYIQNAQYYILEIKWK